jgi:hypothetical protein
MPPKSGWASVAIILLEQRFADEIESRCQNPKRGEGRRTFFRFQSA